ncbi:MAG: BMC domain-containing protein [Christensenellales bacterium]|jgi:microcompartment protein CcmL/EutN
MTIGCITVSGYAAAIYALDHALKAGNVSLLAIETHTRRNTRYRIPMEVCARIAGSAQDVDAALKAALQAARSMHEDDEYIQVHAIPCPEEDTQMVSQIGRVELEELS